MREKILKLIGHNTLYFTKRGNAAIKLALEFAFGKGLSKLYIQDQGGWMTYTQIGEKIGFEVVKIKTNYGLLEDLDLDSDSVLMYSNPAGYVIEQDMKKLYEYCKSKNIIVVCDISGGIGDKYINGNYTDIMICSFGRWKPIWLGEGGFVSFKDDVSLDFEEAALDFEKLDDLIDGLSARMDNLHSICDKIKKELKEFEIIHPKGKGIVVIIKFKDESEKEKIIEYCSENEYEHTECPREIRVLENAISIEVKRIK